MELNEKIEALKKQHPKRAEFLDDCVKRLAQDISKCERASILKRIALLENMPAPGEVKKIEELILSGKANDRIITSYLMNAIRVSPAARASKMIRIRKIMLQGGDYMSGLVTIIKSEINSTQSVKMEVK